MEDIIDSFLLYKRLIGDDMEVPWLLSYIPFIIVLVDIDGLLWTLIGEW